eukprot:9490553-Pyramimonas_sp.AAC.1
MRDTSHTLKRFVAPGGPAQGCLLGRLVASWGHISAILALLGSILKPTLAFVILGCAAATVL